MVSMEGFEKLPRKVQLQIIELIRAPALDPGVPAEDRREAERRASELEKRLKPARRPRKPASKPRKRASKRT